MDTSFDDRFTRILEATGAKSDSGLARALFIRPPSVAAARKRRQIPSGWIEKIAQSYDVRTDWLFFGTGPMRESPDRKETLEEYMDEVAACKEKMLVLQSRLQEKDDTIRVLSMAISALQKQAEMHMLAGNQSHGAASNAASSAGPALEVLARLDAGQQGD